jgi:hypothetical protein
MQALQRCQVIQHHCKHWQKLHVSAVKGGVGHHYKATHCFSENTTNIKTMHWKKNPSQKTAKD